jgi:arylsulfatase A-like enzyme
MDRPSGGPDPAPAPVPVPARTANEERRRPNIVIVTVDCMRRDRVSAYGHDRPTTPFLDSLLDSAAHCTSAHSVSPWTCPAVVSLHTGLYPHNHGGGLVPGEPKNLSKENLPTKLSRDVPTLPEVLAGHGYRSAAEIAVWNANLPMPERYQRQQLLEKPADSLIRRGLKWIGEQDGPFLLWLHLGDAHEPLRVPRDLRDVFGAIPRGKAYRRWAYTKASDPVDTPEFERYRRGRTLLYDAAIRGVDDSLRRLWDGLKAAGMRDRTVLIVSADHGEELWEHRGEEIAHFEDPRGIAGTGHGHNVFQVHLLIPMIVAGPGVPAGEIRGNVSLVDVLPTLGDLTGLEMPRGDGRSIFASLEGRAIRAEGIAYGHEKSSVIEGDRKLLHAPADGYERVFELGPDRTEVRTIEDPALAERLRGHLPTGASAMGEQVESDPEILGHLRELGYIE